jgi:HSP20 family protein
MMTRWDPFSELARMEDRWLRGRGEQGGFAPAVDVYEEKEAITLLAELPGIKPEDVQITVEKGVLTVQGERRQERDETRGAYHRMERSYGHFSRSFVLPEYVDPNAVEANMDAGLLRLRLPKQPAAKPRQIPVRTTTGGPSPEISIQSTDRRPQPNP